MICKYNGGWNCKKKKSILKAIPDKINRNKKNSDQIWKKNNREWNKKKLIL